MLQPLIEKARAVVHAYTYRSWATLAEAMKELEAVLPPHCEGCQCTHR